MLGVRKKWKINVLLLLLFLIHVLKYSQDHKKKFYSSDHRMNITLSYVVLYSLCFRIKKQTAKDLRNKEASALLFISRNNLIAEYIFQEQQTHYCYVKTGYILLIRCFDFPELYSSKVFVFTVQARYWLQLHQPIASMYNKNKHLG